MTAAKITAMVATITELFDPAFSVVEPDDSFVVVCCGSVLTSVVVKFVVNIIVEDGVSAPPLYWIDVEGSDVGEIII
jgi:hypothetical protein